MASVLDLEKRRFIEMELAKVPGAIFEQNAVKICCPFHDDRNPSLGVSLIRGDKFGIGTFNCWSCFPNDTPIISEEGLKPIGDIHVGDKVLSLDGNFNKVYKIIEQEKETDFTKIKAVKFYKGVESTSDHKYFIFKDENVKFGEVTRGKPSIKGPPEEVEAKDVKVGDWLIYPKAQETVFKSIDIPLNLHKYRQVGPKPKDVKEIIHVDKLFAWILGLYVAEGSNYRGPQFALHKKELNFAKRVDRYFSKWGISVTHYEKKKQAARRVYVAHSLLGKWFDEVCGKYARNKKVPSFIFQSPRSVRLAFISGYFMGDGTKHKKDGKLGRRKHRQITTISEKLSQDMMTLLLSVGLCPSVSRRYVKDRGKYNYTVCWSNSTTKLFYSFSTKEYTLYKVESVETYKDKKVVRDLSIEKHPSFCTYFYAVHNCSQGHGGWNKLAQKLGLAQWDEEKKEAVEKDLEANRFLGLINMLDNKSFFKDPTLQGYKKPTTEGLWTGPWRGLPASFLRSLNIEKIWDDDYSEYRLYIPFTDIDRKLIGHVLARGDNSNIPNEIKYLNSKDFPSTSGWLFLDLMETPEWVVIVEGPYDAIRLRYYGIPAIPLVGAKTFFPDEQGKSPKIAKLVAKGVKNAIIMMDGDRAGDEMAPYLYQVLTHYGINAVQMDLKRYRVNPLDDNEKIDPGSCPEAAIKEVQQFLGINYAWTNT